MGGFARRGVVAAAWVLAVAAWPAPATAQEVHEIKFASIAPEGTTPINVMRELGSTVSEKTGGTVRFRFFPGAVAGDEPDVIRKMRAGQLHGGGFTGAGLGLILPEVRVLELPYLFRNSAEIDAVTDELFDHFAAAFEAKGYILLGWAEVGLVYVFTQTPVAQQRDFGKVKMWRWEGDPLAQAMFKALGVTPIPLPLTEVRTSLQTGLINGVYVSALGALALQWSTKVQYVLHYPMTNGTGAILLSRRAFNRLPAAAQELLRVEGRAAMRALVTQTRKDNIASLETMIAQGIISTPPTEQGIRDFQAAAAQVRESLTGTQYPAALLARVLRTIESVRAVGGAN